MGAFQAKFSSHKLDFIVRFQANDIGWIYFPKYVYPKNCQTQDSWSGAMHHKLIWR